MFNAPSLCSTIGQRLGPSAHPKECCTCPLCQWLYVYSTRGVDGNNLVGSLDKTHMGNKTYDNLGPTTSEYFRDLGFHICQNISSQVKEKDTISHTFKFKTGRCLIGCFCVHTAPRNVSLDHAPSFMDGCQFSSTDKPSQISPGCTTRDPAAWVTWPGRYQMLEVYVIVI